MQGPIHYKKLIFILLGSTTLVTSEPVFSQNQGTDPKLEEVVVLGSRVEGRTATESAVPVDIIQSENLNQNGLIQLGEALQTVAPSFNFSRTQVSDSSDLYRPATLRGLQPDQTLVLINGIRRHNQAVFALTGTVGGGAVGTDMNAIPLTALESVEILRDDAAAQYGSDAIAGVINLKLKQTTGVTSGFMQFGQTGEGDGDSMTLGLNTGFALSGNGFFNLSLEYRDADRTNRAEPDLGGSSSIAPGTPSNTIRWHQGDPDSEFTSVFYNSMLEMGAGEFYSFGGYSNRTALGSGFYRDFNRASRNVPQVYQDGFLPHIDNEGKDTSIAVGYRQQLTTQWNLDISANHGSSAYRFDSVNTINASIAAGYLFANPTATDAEIAANAGPTSGFSGGFDFSQLTLNADIKGSIEMDSGNPLHIAYGAEFRNEDYEIIPGEFASYACGPNDDGVYPSVIDNSVNAECGFQAYNGLRPEAANSSDRSSISLYADLERKITDLWLLGFALRFEDYDGIGNKTTGKLSSRYNFSEQFALRGAFATGFRAPSLQQTGYTAFTTTIGGDGNLTNSYTAPAGSALPTALGVPQLKSESSQSISIGLVANPFDNVSVSLDIYDITIDDRITLGGFLTANDLTGNTAALNALADSGVAQANFFSNALDTSTRGIDLVTSIHSDIFAGALTTTLAANLNKTEIDAINTPAGVSETQISPLQNRDFITDAQPQERISLSFDWRKNRLSTLLRFNYFGETEIGYFAGNHIPIPNTQPTSIVEPAVLLDLHVKFDFSENMNFAVGGNNILDKTPDELANNEVLDIISNNAMRYPLRALPYGFNGAYYYMKLAYSF